MKCVLGILAVAVVLAAGGVAAYDYTVGGVGLFGSCPHATASSQSSSCSMCCEQSEGDCTEVCPACEGEKAACPNCTAEKVECPNCPSAKAAKECPACPASGDK
jgi:hypothetical protein